MKKEIGIAIVGPAFEGSIVRHALTEHMLIKHSKVEVVSISRNLNEPEPIIITNPNEGLSPLFMPFKPRKSKQKNNRKGHKRKKAKNGR